MNALITQTENNIDELEGLLALVQSDAPMEQYAEGRSFYFDPDSAVEVVYSDTNLHRFVTAQSLSSEAWDLFCDAYHQCHDTVTALKKAIQAANDFLELLSLPPAYGSKSIQV